MNTMIITGITILIAVIFIITMILRRSKRKNFTLRKMFKKLVKEYGLLIHYKDVFRKKIIGFDKKNKKLLLLDLNKKDKLKACIDMDEIESCDVVHLNDDSNIIKKIFLEIVSKDNDAIRFCFYDESFDDQYDKTCLQLKARHWSQRINFHKNYWWVNAEEYVL
jgi:hypothetical protein